MVFMLSRFQADFHFRERYRLAPKSRRQSNFLFYKTTICSRVVILRPRGYSLDSHLIFNDLCYNNGISFPLKLYKSESPASTQGFL